MVIGTLDPCYNVAQLDELRAVKDFRLAVLPNVHHGLEDPDDYVKSIRIIETICRAVEDLMDSH